MAEDNMNIEIPKSIPGDTQHSQPENNSGFPVNLNGHKNKKPENGTISYGTDADEPLEGNSIALSPEDFELFEKLLIENLGFTPEDAGRYCEQYAETYYNGTRKVKKSVSTALNGAFAAFVPIEPNSEDEIDF